MRMANCTIEVTFTPTQAGGRTGQLTINANVAGGQLTAALSGTGEDGGAVTLAPITLSFGTVEVGRRRGIAGDGQRIAARSRFPSRA